MLILITVLSCSGSQGSPVGGIGVSDCDNVAMNPTSHNNWGLWQFSFDKENGQLDILPLRVGSLHLNALPFLEPPPYVKITIESLKVNGSIIDADIGLRHPFLGLNIYTGFDVCGIFITSGSVSGFSEPGIVLPGDGDTRLLNPDGYSRWWNPTEFPVNNGTIFGYTDGLVGTPYSVGNFNSTLNGYKYFCDDLEADDPLENVTIEGRGMFMPGMKRVRHYTIQMGTGLVFNYAIDACWKVPQGDAPYTAPDDFPPGANRPEAWMVSIHEIDNTLWNDGSASGGSLRLSVDVYDWFDADLNTVRVEWPGKLPVSESTTVTGGGDGFSTYEVEIIGATPDVGETEMLISVISGQENFAGFIPGTNTAAYFTCTAPVSAESPTVWARTWGGVDGDQGNDVDVDGFGNSYITGSFRDTVDFDPGTGIDNHTSNGASDVFLSKFNTDGDFQWARTWGASSMDNGYGVAADDTGNVYITGGFWSTIDFGPGTYELSSNGWDDAFLCKFDTNGNFQWAHNWGGGFNDRGYGIALDNSGDVYVTGYFSGTIDFDPGEGTDTHSSSALDVFLTKFDSNGNFQWARTWGGVSFEDGFCAVAADASGNVYATGYFRSTVDFDPGPGTVEYTSNGLNDVFLSKFNSSGDFQWARTWGGTDDDRGRGIAVDASDNVYSTGYFRETADLDPGAGVENHTSQGWDDTFLSMFNTDGDFQWARTWGGIYVDTGEGISIDFNGNIHVGGYFSDIVDFNPGIGIDDITSSGAADVYLNSLNSNGDFRAVLTFGGPDVDLGYGLAMDYDGKAYMTGLFAGTADFHPHPDIDDFHTSNGIIDVFLVKLSPE